MITKEEIIKINKELGGEIINLSSLDFALKSEEKNIYKRNALLIRAIVVDHPFSDMNKSTATISIIRNFREKGIKCKEESLFRGLEKIASKNITNLNKIERGLRKWCPKTK
mgnify:CR=1 FL=1